MKWFRYGAVLLLFSSLFFLPDPNVDYLFLQTVAKTSEEAFNKFASDIQSSTDGKENEDGFKKQVTFQVSELDIRGGGAEADAKAVEREIKRIITLDLNKEYNESGFYFFYIDGAGTQWGLNKDEQIIPCEDIKDASEKEKRLFTLHAEKGADNGHAIIAIPEENFKHDATREYCKLYSLFPPLAAILIALLFQKTIIALFCGVWLGATLLSNMNPLYGLGSFFKTYLYEKCLTDQFHVDIIGFVVFLCATVGVLTKGAGIKGFVNFLMKFAKTVRSTQAVTFLMGIGIFFDDYANCIIVGNTLRPLTDKLKISREKLAYIVDSTAAPIAGLSMLSTWIAYEVSTFAPQLPEAGVTEGPYDIFIQTIPYRFYCILTLIFIVMMIIMQRDFGPMLKAERRARRKGEVIRPGGKPMVSSSLTNIEPKEGAPARWYNAFLPIMFIIIVTIEGLWRTGGGWENYAITDIFSGQVIREVLGQADVTNPIFVGSIAGFLLAVILMMSQRILTLKECIHSAIKGSRALLIAIVILLLAWCIGGVCKDIGTAHYLIALFKGAINPILFPTILFLTSCIVAFATGSSWSTMAILLPNTVIFAMKVGETSAIGDTGMLIISIGAVLEGSIFGDHCSPISDTTILSSVSSASDHMDHIKTQAPYAMLTMGISILAGYIPAAMGLSPLISILIGAVALFLCILFIGKKSHEIEKED